MPVCDSSRTWNGGADGRGLYCRLALVSPDGLAPNRMVGVSASVNLSLHHKVQKFSSDTGSPEWFRKKGRKTLVVVVHGKHDSYYDTVVRLHVD